jgi:hypothetical protein
MGFHLAAGKAIKRMAAAAYSRVVCTENSIRVDDMTESPKLAE